MDWSDELNRAEAAEAKLTEAEDRIKELEAEIERLQKIILDVLKEIEDK